MNDIISVQLAISKLHFNSLMQQEPSSAVADQALAELNTALAELEATNTELGIQNEALIAATSARDVEIRRYQELFERIPVAYVVTDKWAVIREVNAAAEQLLGASRAMLENKPLTVFLPSDDRREFRDWLSKVEAGGTARRQVIMQPRGSDRIEVQVDVARVPASRSTDAALGWILQNLTPGLVAASAEKMLARETQMRLEAQAAILRLRGLHAGLETMAQGAQLPVEMRITSLLEALVPRFAQQITCYFPQSDERSITIGNAANADHVLQTVIIGPGNSAGRLLAKRTGPFLPEDRAILQSVANGVSLLLLTTR